MKLSIVTAKNSPCALSYYRLALKVSTKLGPARFRGNIALFLTTSIACALATGCLTSSSPMPSSLGNNLRLEKIPSALTNSIPTDDSKPRVAVYLANVECNALITGRPLELAEYVRKSLAQSLSSSGNFIVAENSRAAGFLIEVKISSLERGISKRSDNRGADLILESSQQQEKRSGILELQVAVTDPAGKMIHSFSATSQTEDATSTKKASLLGFTSVGATYQRRADSDVVSEVAAKVALGLWRRLVNPTEPVSNLNN